jgi:hypothetical protein
MMGGVHFDDFAVLVHAAIVDASEFEDEVVVEGGCAGIG